MDKKNYKTFNKFWDEIKPQRISLDVRPEDEIMKEIIEIEKSFEKGGS
jgi:hypothetical protein